MKKRLMVIISILAVLVIAYFFVTSRDRIKSYRFYSKSKVIESQPTRYKIADGDSYILSITEGMGPSKTTTAHGYWDTIYLVLNKPPKVGETQILTEVYRDGYRRGSGWGIDPDYTEKISITPLELSDAKSKFKITGVLRLRMWWKIYGEDIASDSVLGVYGSQKVHWRPVYDNFKFNSIYTLKPGTIKKGENWGGDGF